MLNYPHINPVALHLGPVQIHWYGIMYVIGFAMAWWLARRQASRAGSTWNAEQVDDLIFWAMVGVILGGRIGYVLLYVLPYQLDLLQADWLYPLKIWKGGMSFHGALLGVIVSLLWYARTHGRRSLDVLDFCAPLPGIGICAGRIGNFINGELWGAPTDWRWGFLVPDANTGELVGRHASQLYEAAFEGIALYLLLAWYSRRQRPMGAIIGLGLVWYALVRMLVELVRVPDAQIGYMAGDWLTMGQVLSVPMLLMGVVLLLRAAMQPQASGNFTPRSVKNYLELLRAIRERGQPKGDRTGTGTLSLFGWQMRFDLAAGFPLVTTKRVHLPSVVHELLWFLRGETNVRYLRENGVSIWDEWADAEGDLGPVYGKQWRAWGAADGRSIDQLAGVIETLKRNPDSRRMVVSAWNVGELDAMALLPCHALFQFYVGGGKLSCQLYQRSADVFLGVPFNIASYALLTHLVAQQCDLDVGDFVWTGGDCHLYVNHLAQADLQLSREPLQGPRLQLRRRPASLFEYQAEDIEFVNYQHHAPIKAPVAV